VWVHIKRCHVVGLESRPGGQTRLNSLQNETRRKSLALFLAELWTFEVVLLKKLILRKMHLKF